MKLQGKYSPSTNRGGVATFVKLVAIFVALFLGISFTCAYFTATAKATGDMQFANLSVQAVTSTGDVYTSEVFTNRIKTRIKPGDNYEIKDIYVKNTGETDVYALLEVSLNVKKENSTEVSYTKTYWFNCAGTELTGDIRATSIEATHVAKGDSVQTVVTIQIPGELDNTYKKATADVVIKIHAIQSELTAETGTTIAATASRLIYSSKSDPINTAYYKRIDKDGTPNENGEYILFGMYPQTIKSADVTIDETDIDTNGYYLGSDGERYYKFKANPNYDKYKFSDSTSIVKDQEYYFKVEPLKWRILTTKYGKATLFSEDVVDAKRWDASNVLNYSTSLIRNFINNDFYTRAFNELEQEVVQITNVDNSKETTKSETDDYTCENTFDKVFLLSYEDLINTQYGFVSGLDKDTSRVKNPSDYARANYLQSNELPDTNPNCSWYFLRSPEYTSWGNGANMVFFSGNISTGGIGASLGVAPAITILL